MCSIIKSLLEFDFYVNTTWKIQFHQSVNCFLSWVDDVDQAFVSTLDTAAEKIVETATRTGATVAGPVPLPTERSLYTIIRDSQIQRFTRTI